MGIVHFASMMFRKSDLDEVEVKNRDSSRLGNPRHTIEPLTHYCVKQTRFFLLERHVPAQVGNELAQEA
jgi:hypothetical protein